MCPSASVSPNRGVIVRCSGYRSSEVRRGSYRMGGTAFGGRDCDPVNISVIHRRPRSGGADGVRLGAKAYRLPSIMRSRMRAKASVMGAMSAGESRSNMSRGPPRRGRGPPRESRVADVREFGPRAASVGFALHAPHPSRVLHAGDGAGDATAGRGARVREVAHAHPAIGCLGQQDQDFEVGEGDVGVPQQLLVEILEQQARRIQIRAPQALFVVAEPLRFSHDLQCTRVS